MSNTVIRVEHLSNQYGLGAIGSHRLRYDLSRWWDTQPDIDFLEPQPMVYNPSPIDT